MISDSDSASRTISGGCPWSPGTVRAIPRGKRSALWLVWQGCYQGIVTVSYQGLGDQMACKLRKTTASSVVIAGTVLAVVMLALVAVIA